MATPILIDTTIDGKPTKAAVVSNRNGFFYAIDRSDGRFLYAMPLIDGINWTNGLDSENGQADDQRSHEAEGRRQDRAADRSRSRRRDQLVPARLDPSLGLIFVAVNQWGMGLTSWEKGKLQYKPGDVYQGVDYQMYRTGDVIGHLKAIDVANKKVVWDVASSLPLFAGILATKGGVVFTGDQRGRLLPSTRRPERSSGSSRPDPGSTRRRSPTSSTENNMSRSFPGLGGDPSFYYSAPKGGMLWVFAIDGKVDEGGMYNAQVIEKMLPSKQ